MLLMLNNRRRRRPKVKIKAAEYMFLVNSAAS
jgi:hypothetical protein